MLMPDNFVTCQAEKSQMDCLQWKDCKRNIKKSYVCLLILKKDLMELQGSGVGIQEEKFTINRKMSGVDLLSKSEDKR